MRTLLLIEDNEANRDMLSRRLDRAGYLVRTCVNAFEGIRDARQVKPDLILMDLRLPGMNGWEAAQQIKSDSATQAIPIIALTAHAMEGDRDKALLAGCDDYDVKPIDLPRLLDKIDRLLHRPPLSGHNDLGVNQHGKHHLD
jgi:two-component system cell cycle response regulator DivK